MHVAITRIIIKRTDMQYVNFETNRNNCGITFSKSSIKQHVRNFGEKMEYKLVRTKRRKKIKGRLKSNYVTGHIKYK